MMAVDVVTSSSGAAGMGTASSSAFRRVECRTHNCRSALAEPRRIGQSVRVRDCKRETLDGTDNATPTRR